MDRIPLRRVAAAGRAMRVRTGNHGRAALTAGYVLLAGCKRALMRDTTFIGVTGSTGKTTTKILIGRVLEAGGRHGRYTIGSLNSLRYVARNVWRGRPDDQFHVLELSAGAGPGSLAPMLRFVRPRIGVVTNIGVDHVSAFGDTGTTGIAREKGTLVSSLPPDGLAVLNADDPLTPDLAARAHCRVVTFGHAPAADFRIESVEQHWPAGTAVIVRHGTEVVRVRTRFHGLPVAYAVAAALAVGHALGVPLARGAAGIADVEPMTGRMSLLDLPGGITCIRDDWKSSIPTFAPALDFLRGLQVPRRIAVIGTISDVRGDAGARYREVARAALAAAEQVIFVGPQAFSVLREQPADEPRRLLAFGTVRAASDFLAGFLRAGDVMLIKGSNAADHICRVALARLGPVTCWGANCGRKAFCDQCERLRVPAGEDDPDAPPEVVMPARPSAAAHALASRAQVVLVGLGNAGSRYAGTGHNAGRDCLDAWAEREAAEWLPTVGGAIAMVRSNDRLVLLLKPDGFMNHSGRALSSFLEAHDVPVERCVLLHDDHDLPLGTVRMRMRGGDGGHRGVRSVLEAFQTDRIPRIKLGVRGGDGTGKAGDAVLGRLGGPAEEALRQAYRLVAEEVARVAMPEAKKAPDARGPGDDSAAASGAVVRQGRPPPPTSGFTSPPG